MRSSKRKCWICVCTERGGNDRWEALPRATVFFHPDEARAKRDEHRLEEEFYYCSQIVGPIRIEVSEEGRTYISPYDTPMLCIDGDGTTQRLVARGRARRAASKVRRFENVRQHKEQWLP
jgi:hypothetical protein